MRVLLKVEPSSRPDGVTGEFWRRSPFHPLVLAWLDRRRRNNNDYVYALRVSAWTIEQVAIIEQTACSFLLLSPN